MSDLLTTGPVNDNPQQTDTPEQPHRKQWRKIEEWNGDPPSVDGKIPIQFPIKEKCDVKLPKTKEGYDRGKCKSNLIVVRVKNTIFEWDEHGNGGQLNYSENDQRAYKYCPIHGPFPVGLDKWPSK